MTEHDSIDRQPDEHSVIKGERGNEYGFLLMGKMQKLRRKNASAMHDEDVDSNDQKVPDSRLQHIRSKPVFDADDGQRRGGNLDNCGREIFIGIIGPLLSAGEPEPYTQDDKYSTDTDDSVDHK